MNTARQVALRTLLRIRRTQSYSTLLLGGVLDGASLDPRDAALVTRLVYGVIERGVTLDHQLSLYLKTPLSRLRPDVLTILRLGAYQLLFSDKIPVSAAVNESVELAKREGAGYAAGMVNAVLRKVAAAGLVLPPETDECKFISVKYSCPEPLVRHLLDSYGRAAAEAHLSACVQPRPVFIRPNPMRCTPQTLHESLLSQGAEMAPTALEGCYTLTGAGSIPSLAAFEKGMFHVQDLSSQLASAFVDPKPGQTVADCCAAPGGKSCTLAELMHDEGRVISCDVHEHKTALIKEGADRLGLKSIVPVCCDARSLPERVGEADAVLCDVPCSGYGVMGRKPEIRYKAPSQFASLPALQYEILNACAAMVRRGGTLVYSTCTLNPAENERVCERFLASHGDFTVSGEAFYRSKTNGAPFMTVFASPTGGDGFFAAKFERRG